MSGVLSAFRRLDARICRLFDRVGLEISLLPYDLRFFGEGIGPHFQSLSSKAAGLFRLIGENVRLLVEAIGLYRSAGYREVDAFNDEPYAHHWFEKRLEQTDGSAVSGSTVG